MTSLAHRRRIGVEEGEDVAQLKLGKEFEKASCLMINEVKMLIDNQGEDAKRVSREPGQLNVTKKMWEYVERFSPGLEPSDIARLRSALLRESLADFEACSLANLRPKTVEEAKAILPSIQREAVRDGEPPVQRDDDGIQAILDLLEDARGPGRAGPLFVALAAILISICAFTFFEVVFPRIFWQPEHSALRSSFGIFWCCYIVYAFCFHYWMAIKSPPGQPSDFHLSAPDIARHPRYKLINALAGLPRGSGRPKSEDTPASMNGRTCKKCPRVDGKEPAKPERTHHCSICRKCFLKYDHHCPWLNSCVAHGNERYFVLFMVYLSIACICVVSWGLPSLLATLDHSKRWPYRSPRVATVLLWVLCAAIGAALIVMSLWQLWLVMRGETSVEASDNEWYHQRAKETGTIYYNVYDLGRVHNLQEFFNVPSSQGRYPYWTVLLPIAVPPATDGRNFKKRAGWRDITVDEELTDEELSDHA
ncbi:uncharacterized protein L969DRAFT_49717 [Mixia osmundae IAM 14324]|uniref:Palmitoyltransferase n=1 Tax=Mixia osmundae (strain CBS 9802 / IAM 14324 / JCM 22182 / KY 12970) TaxID=764103 RepID=G7E7F4_MIXOS|nr:uncharacterized protein L969DRAFT_49717 [Mixia osmundae IAM 14324]KEI38924.1 hypothetical protein L969DRAFT_49717 [Mixia osmundae IAM 14324]GAA98764.1 hypothetical protein E5Q_05452 [Mixia osmundae IAM 14324]